jgi:hypothetical protein
MTQLSSLRSRLNDLRRRRQAVRLGTGYAAIALAVLWTLVTIFVVDWLFELSKLQRVLSMLFGVIAIVWATRRFARPWLGVHESELDMALLVEKQQRIDSDLVAALQFESAEASRWGSTQLERAVIGYVAEFGKSWNILEGFSRQELVRRGSALVATVALIGLAIVIFPAHVRVFANRLLLGSAHYPTATQFERIMVNGQEIDFESASPATVKIPYGRPVKFEVHGAGELPDAGSVELHAVDGDMTTAVDLSKASTPGETAVYSGQLPKAIDSVHYQLYLGDAWTEPAEIEVVEFPNIDVRFRSTPPSYAQGTQGVAEEVTSGSRQISVLEGSSINLEVACTNKVLTRATLNIEGTSFPLQSSNSTTETARPVWRLTQAETPFARVGRPLQYEIQVLDDDGLELDQPIRGSVRIKADQKPRVTAEVVTRVVLPTASPRVMFRARDDFGVKQVIAHLEPAGENASATATTVPIWPQKPADSQVSVAGEHRLNLTSLGLKPGDELKVTLEAVDDRGEAPGQSGRSETIVFQITDESGILAAISESDERSARQLDAIIKRQLGIGDSK